MNKKHFTLIGIIIIFAIAMGFAYNMINSNQNHQLKIWSPNELNPIIVDPSMQAVSRNHKIADFKLIDQDGDTITNENYTHKVYIADFFYTTCPDICPKLTSNMKRVYEAYKGDTKVAFISHTVTPKIDSPAVLKAYAKEYDAKAPQWEFVTGPKKEIYNLARKSYCVAQNAPKKGAFDLIHTQNITLIDTNRRIRGYYDGLDNQDIDRLIKDIKTLLKYH